MSSWYKLLFFFKGTAHIYCSCTFSQSDTEEMRYCSTRGGVHGWDFRDVLFSGYAPDGGMFMPETIPSISPATLRCWCSLSYQQLVCEVCSLFIPEQLIPKHDLEGNSDSRAAAHPKKHCHIQDPSLSFSRPRF